MMAWLHGILFLLTIQIMPIMKNGERRGIVSRLCLAVIVFQQSSLAHCTHIASASPIMYHNYKAIELLPLLEACGIYEELVSYIASNVQ